MSKKESKSSKLVRYLAALSEEETLKILLVLSTDKQLENEIIKVAKVVW